jgi:hypothetical protein
MKNLTYVNLGNWSNNEPFNSESYPETSILPERFRAISEPSEISIVSDDLNSITLPQLTLVSTEG